MISINPCDAKRNREGKKGRGRNFLPIYDLLSYAWGSYMRGRKMRMMMSDRIPIKWSFANSKKWRRIK